MSSPRKTEAKRKSGKTRKRHAGRIRILIGAGCFLRVACRGACCGPTGAVSFAAFHRLQG